MKKGKMIIDPIYWVLVITTFIYLIIKHWIKGDLEWTWKEKRHH